MILNEDYKFRDDIKADTVPVEMLVGPYKGTVVRYTKVAIIENEQETATLKFEYDLLNIPEGTSEVSLRNDVKFNEHAGLVLNSLILEYVDADQTERGEDHSEEPIEE